MPSRYNGGVIGKANTPTLSEAKGVWNMNAVHRARLSNTWPVASTSSILYGASSDTNTFASSASAKTVSITLGSEANRIAIVTFGMNYLVGSTTVKFNGVSMTKADDEVVGSSYHCATYYMLEASLPGAGTYNVEVDSEHAVRGGLCCSYIYGAKQQAPEAIVSANGSSVSSPYSNNITTLTPYAWVVDSIFVRDASSLSPSVGQTQRFNFIDTSNYVIGSSTKEVPAAGSASMGWTFTGTASAFLQVLSSWEKA